MYWENKSYQNSFEEGSLCWELSKHTMEVHRRQTLILREDLREQIEGENEKITQVDAIAEISYLVTKIVIIGQNAQPWKKEEEEKEKRDWERRGEEGKDGGKERRKKINQQNMLAPIRCTMIMQYQSPQFPLGY